jgi:outer membrane receptor protein involved in Fe transport
VTTSGYVGRDHYYQDPRMQKIYGFENPYQERPIARPIFRANITLSTPEDLGPTVAGIKPFGNFHFSLLYTWKAGRWMTWDPLKTYKLVNNLQWKHKYNLDARLSKKIGHNINLFVNIENLLNTKYIHNGGFYSAGNDEWEYYASLHLSMYKDDEYRAAGLPTVPSDYDGTADEYYGEIDYDDKPGDIKSKDKPYIDMPNRKFLTFIGPRSFNFGLGIEF